MINDELTKSFEKEFPLPWGVEFRDTAAFIRPVDMPEQYSIFLDTNIPDHIGAVRYAVQCANLMPEAVEVIRDLIGIAAVLDYGADNAVTRAKQLLAKLEGGAEDDRNNPRNN